MAFILISINAFGLQYSDDVFDVLVHLTLCKWMQGPDYNFLCSQLRTTFASNHATQRTHETSTVIKIILQPRHPRLSPAIEKSGCRCIKPWRRRGIRWMGSVETRDDEGAIKHRSARIEIRAVRIVRRTPQSCWPCETLSGVSCVRSCTIPLQFCRRAE